MNPYRTGLLMKKGQDEGDDETDDGPPQVPAQFLDVVAEGHPRIGKQVFPWVVVNRSILCSWLYQQGATGVLFGEGPAALGPARHLSHPYQSDAAFLKFSCAEFARRQGKKSGAAATGAEVPLDWPQDNWPALVRFAPPRPAVGLIS